MFWKISSRRGYQLLREGKWDSALDSFQELSRRFPRRADPFFEAGKLQFKKGDLSAARQSLLACLERAPGPEIISGILELTNWWMLSSPSFYNADPCFSPDGQQLLFTSARHDTNGDGKIDARDRAGIYKAEMSSGVVTELISNTYHNSAPQWSPDGRSVLYFSSRPFGQAVPPEDDTKAQHLLLRDLETNSDALLIPASLNPRYPVFTPDGQNVIVCTVDHTGGPSGLSLVNVQSQLRKSLTSHATEHTYPQISPDGKSLLYVSWRGLGQRVPTAQDNPGIYLMNLATGKERLLVKDQFSNAYPRFSPEGDSVLYLSRRRDTNGDGRITHLDNFGIYALRLSDGQERCVSPDDHYNKFAAWSTDGRWVLFSGHWVSDRKATVLQGEDYFEFKGLYRIPAAGGKAHTIVSDKFFGSRHCAVSPQGSLLAYISWRPASNRGLYVADYLKPPSLDQLRSFIQNNLS